MEGPACAGRDSPRGSGGGGQGDVRMKAAIRAEAERLFAAFQAAGAVPVEADTLLPAETLLDLYGEDIRARAYVTQDPLMGEMMLRPDFTVPVVQAHMAHGADPARYCYLGEVFRKSGASGCLVNILQVGFEVFDRAAPAEADAEVFALVCRVAGRDQGAACDWGYRHPDGGGAGVGHHRPAQGGAVAAYLAARAVSRSCWTGFRGGRRMPAARAALLERLATGTPEALIAAAGPMIGLRAVEDMAERAAALIEDAGTARDCGARGGVAV